VTELDRADLARILPAPTGPPDWDDVLGRSQVHERRRRLLTLAIAVLVAALATASAFGVHAYVLDKGFIGLPPEGATSSSPEGAELVLSAYGVGSEGRTRLWVFADGRLITQRELHGQRPESANDRSSGYLEQRLTAEGVERLRSEALGTGLFERDLGLILDDGQPCLNFVSVRRGDRLVRTTWKGSQCGAPPGWPAEFGLGDKLPATPAQSAALVSLVERLTAATRWLPASAWQDPAPRAYVPTRFAIQYGVLPPSIETSRVFALLPPAAAEILRSRARAERAGFTGSATDPAPRRYVYYVSELTTAESRALSEALKAGGVGLNSHGIAKYVLSYEGPVPGAGPDGFYFVEFEPMLPNGEWACSACG